MRSGKPASQVTVLRGAGGQLPGRRKESQERPRGVQSGGDSTFSAFLTPLDVLLGTSSEEEGWAE